MKLTDAILRFREDLSGLNTFFIVATPRRLYEVTLTGWDGLYRRDEELRVNLVSIHNGKRDGHGDFDLSILGQYKVSSVRTMKISNKRFLKFTCGYV